MQRSTKDLLPPDLQDLPVHNPQDLFVSSPIPVIRPRREHVKTDAVLANILRDSDELVTVMRSLLVQAKTPDRDVSSLEARTKFTRYPNLFDRQVEAIRGRGASYQELFKQLQYSQFLAAVCKSARIVEYTFTPAREEFQTDEPAVGAGSDWKQVTYGKDGRDVLWVSALHMYPNYGETPASLLTYDQIKALKPSFAGQFDQPPYTVDWLNAQIQTFCDQVVLPTPKRIKDYLIIHHTVRPGMTAEAEAKVLQDVNTALLALERCRSEAPIEASDDLDQVLRALIEVQLQVREHAHREIFALSDELANVALRSTVVGEGDAAMQQSRNLRDEAMAIQARVATALMNPDPYRAGTENECEAFTDPKSAMMGYLALERMCSYQAIIPGEDQRVFLRWKTILAREARFPQIQEIATEGLRSAELSSHRRPLK